MAHQRAVIVSKAVELFRARPACGFTDGHRDIDPPTLTGLTRNFQAKEE